MGGASAIMARPTRFDYDPGMVREFARHALGLVLAMASTGLPAQGGSAPQIVVHLTGHPAAIHQDAVQDISWHVSSAPGGATVSLWAEKTVTGHLLGPIASNLPLRGHYQWHVPEYRPKPIPCARDRTGGCVGGMNPGTTYAIVARVYASAAARRDHLAGQPRVLASVTSAEFLMKPAAP